MKVLSVYSKSTEYTVPFCCSFHEAQVKELDPPFPPTIQKLLSRIYVTNLIEADPTQTFDRNDLQEDENKLAGPKDWESHQEYQYLHDFYANTKYH